MSSCVFFLALSVGFILCSFVILCMVFLLIYKLFQSLLSLYFILIAAERWIKLYNRPPVRWAITFLVTCYILLLYLLLCYYVFSLWWNKCQQSAMMKTDAGTCASLSVSLLTTSSRLSNHFLLYTPIDLRFRLYQQSNQTWHSDQPKIYPTVF